MYSIRIHARAGQGAKTIAQIIASAAFADGYNVQAFPEYGPDRSGAPMKAYVRIDKKEIRTVESVKEPTIVMVLDNTLINTTEVRSGINSQTILIENVQLNGVPPRYQNTVYLGVLVRHWPILKEVVVREEIEKHFAHKNQLENIKAFETGLHAK